MSNPHASYQHDTEATHLLQRVKEKTAKNYITNDDGFLCYQPAGTRAMRLYVPGTFRKDILELLHSVPLAGHLAKDKTIHRIKRFFHWPGIDEDVTRFIKECLQCGRAKYRTHKPGRVHIPYPIPESPWEVMHIDFKTGLPRTKRGHDSFIIVMCRLTKRMHLIPCKKNITTEQTAELLFWEAIRHHGFPEKIISDRDPRFTSHYWTNLWKYLYTKLNMSTARHPSTDSQAERGIRTMVEMLRAFCSHHPNQWEELFGAYEFAYNDSVHPQTGYTPFQLDMGRCPHTPVSLLIQRFVKTGTKAEPFEFLRTYSKVIDNVKERLEKFSKKQAQLLQQRSSPAWSYEPGDQVLLENPRVNDIRLLPALEDRFIGPYMVLEYGAQPIQTGFFKFIGPQSYT